MIDKIKLFIPNKRLDTKNQNIQNQRKTDTNTIKGHIKNFGISQNIDGIFLQGSLAKYLNDENITPLTKEQIKESVYLLQDDLKVDFSNAIVTGLEFGTSIILDNPVSLYLQCMGTVPRKVKYTAENDKIETINYLSPKGKGIYTFTLYDKIQECINHKISIPETYQGKNVLRLEYKIQRNQGMKNLFYNPISLFCLYEDNTLYILKNKFSEFYNSIEKIHRDILIPVSLKNNLTQKGFEDLFCEIQRQTNPDIYNNFLYQVNEMGLLRKDSLKNIKKKNRKKSKEYTFSKTNDLIVELNKKLQIQGLYEP